MSPRQIAVYVGTALAVGGVAVFLAPTTEPPPGTRFAVTTFAVYDSLKEAGWPISPVPTWKPDSSLVLFDVDGNVPFSPEQILVLDDLGAVIIAESGIREYLAENGWIVERQFP